MRAATTMTRYQPKMTGGGAAATRTAAMPQTTVQVRAKRVEDAPRAAGQASLDAIWGFDPTGKAGITQSTPPAEAAGTVKDKFDQAAAQSGKPNPVGGLSDQALGNLFTGIGTVLGASAQAVAAVIASGNQIEIARINNATTRYIEELRAQGRYQEAQNAAALQTSLANNAGYIPPPPQTGWTNTEIALAATLGVVVIGGLGYALMSRRGRRNPVISNGRNRFYAQPDVAAHYLESEGYSIVGKTSSTRRRRRAR